MYRVLIVDDEVPFLQSLAMFDWEANDCRCIGQATNGQEAMEKCLELAPHIVITDINMPVVDGLSFLSALHQQFPEIQVILLTVHRNFDYAQKAVKLGACDYLVKDMDYRHQLLSVLSKAKRSFEEQPAQGSSRVSLLSKSGHMLVIESDSILEAYAEEVENFLRQHAGALITARLSLPCDSLHSLVFKLDSWPGAFEEAAGTIVRSKSCFEFLTGQTMAGAENWLSRMLAEDRKMVLGKEVFFALTPCGRTVSDYTKAHQKNIMMLERSFYHPQPSVLISRDTRFTPLSPSAANEWIHRTELLSGRNEETEKLVKEIAAEALKEQFEPESVRSAFDRMLYKYELRYASASDQQSHAFLQNAPNLSALTQKMLETVHRIQCEQNNYSFIVCQATEYMTDHMGDPSLQLNETAEHVCISPGYLSKKLKEETGKTFQELLINMKMEYAAKVLKNSDKKVYEVSDMVGYENYRSFASAFSNYYGVSPKKYR